MYISFTIQHSNYTVTLLKAEIQLFPNKYFVTPYFYNVLLLFLILCHCIVQFTLARSLRSGFISQLSTVLVFVAQYLYMRCTVCVSVCSAATEGLAPWPRPSSLTDRLSVKTQSECSRWWVHAAPLGPCVWEGTRWHWEGCVDILDTEHRLAPGAEQRAEDTRTAELRPSRWDCFLVGSRWQVTCQHVQEKDKVQRHNAAEIQVSMTLCRRLQLTVAQSGSSHAALWKLYGEIVFHLRFKATLPPGEVT